MTLTNAVTTLPDQTECLVRRAIGCCLAVHRELGPGLSEAVYSRAVAIELTAAAIHFEVERPFPVRYRGHLLCHQRVDLYLEQQLVLEIKAVEQLHPVHIAQAVSYLRLTGAPIALVVNFNVRLLKQGIRRVVL
jgi:GxxExxY protein